MRPGKRGRLTTRIAVAVTLAAALIGGAAVVVSADTMATDVWWGYSVDR